MFAVRFEASGSKKFAYNYDWIEGQMLTEEIGAFRKSKLYCFHLSKWNGTATEFIGLVPWPEQEDRFLQGMTLRFKEFAEYLSFETELFKLCKSRGKLAVSEAIDAFRRGNIFSSHFDKHPDSRDEFAKKRIVEVITDWITASNLDGFYDEKNEQYLSTIRSGYELLQGQRTPPSTCPECGQGLKPEFRLCPACGYKIFR